MRLAYIYDLPLPVPLAAPIQILKTCAAFAERGIEVEVHCGRLRRPPAACLAYYGVEPSERLRLVPSLALPSRLRFRATLRRLLGRTDLVMSRGETGVWVAALLGELGAGDRFIYEAHRPAAPIRGRLRGLIGRRSAQQTSEWERLAVDRSAAVVCISRGVADDLAERLGPRGPLEVVPSGVDPPLPDTPLCARDLDLLYAGKLEDRKGPRLALAALARVPSARLVIAGGGRRAITALRRESASLGVEDRVRFLGYLPPPRARELFLRARVGLCPFPANVSAVTERFNSPMKLLESMASGAAAVASDLPSVRELVRNGAAGPPPARLVPADDPDALAAACAELLHDDRSRLSLADAGQRHVLRFTWPERARRLHELFTRVLG